MSKLSRPQTRAIPKRSRKTTREPPPPIFKVKLSPINDKNRLSPNLANKGIIWVSSPRFVSVLGNPPLRIKRNLFGEPPPKHEGCAPKADYSCQAKISESARVALFRNDPVFINEHSQQEQPRNDDIPPIPFQEHSHTQAFIPQPNHHRRASSRIGL